MTFKAGGRVPVWQGRGLRCYGEEREFRPGRREDAVRGGERIPSGRGVGEGLFVFFAAVRGAGVVLVFVGDLAVEAFAHEVVAFEGCHHALCVGAAYVEE